MIIVAKGMTLLVKRIKESERLSLNTVFRLLAIPVFIILFYPISESMTEIK